MTISTQETQAISAPAIEGLAVEPADLVIHFPKSAIVGEVEKLLATHLDGKRVNKLELNFAKSEFIEVATLIVLVAIATSRKRQGLNTQIKLPDTKRTRDFLRLWSFPETIQLVTGISFRRICKKEDDQYFGENPNFEHHSYASAFQDDGVRRLENTRFFSLQTYELTGGIEKVEGDFKNALKARSHTKLVELESGRWNGAVIKSVLDKQLKGGPGGYVSSRIVFESMTNAIRHSKACFIVAGSMIREPGAGPKSTGMFTLVYWDDGDSMIDTLKEAIHLGKSIKSKSISLPPDDFRFQTEKDGEIVHEKIISSSFLPTKETPDEELLLATTFPGITRDVTSKGHASLEVKMSRPEYDAPGMGLHLLLNTAIDVFGGSVGIRTKNHFMSLKKNPDPGNSRYLAKVSILSENLNSFVGNMLTIRLPIVREK